MAIFGNQGFKHFLSIQLISFQIFLFIICLLSHSGFSPIYFWCCLPMILILMYLYYLIFWKPQTDQTTCFMFFNFFLFILTFGIFFGIFFGMFKSTIGFKFEKAIECQVIGKSSVQYDGVENYSMLYVDFNLDGENLLGYGCQSNQYDQIAGQGNIKPYQFYTSDSEVPCSQRFLEDLSQPMNSQIKEIQRKNQDNYINISQDDFSRSCFQRYTFSEVKLPSWMCLSQEVSYEELIDKKTCYVNFFSLNNESEDYSAYQNAINRSEIKKQKNFALISFSKFPTPEAGYICFLVFCLSPLILTTNIFFIPLIQLLQSFLDKQTIKLKKIEYQNINIY